MTMSYYIKPFGQDAHLVLNDRAGRVLAEIDGKVMCSQPFQLKNPARRSAPAYPVYQAISVKGITDIVEHKKMEPLFYLTDDPAVWRRYMAIGCSS